MSGKRGAEGGEWVLSRRRLRARSSSATAPAPRGLRPPRGVELDGLQASAVRMKGYSLVVSAFHAFCSIGWTGCNLRKFSRLGALVSALRLP